MERELVVKDNALINASYSLNLVEQRLMLLAIVALRKDYYQQELDLCFKTVNEPITITAESYIKNFNVDPSTAYKGLKEACKTLFARQFSYQEQRGVLIANVTARWVQKIAYIEKAGTIEVLFTTDVLPLIVHLEKHLTSYELQQVADLRSSYAVRLYELLISWRSTGKTPKFKLEEFRKNLGIQEHEYKRMGQFKEKVLHIALEQINTYTDIAVEYEQHKQGRVITDFSFKFKQKQVKEPLEHKENYNLTDKQISFFANKLAHDDAFASQYAEVGEEYTDLERRLTQKLRDKDFVQKIFPDLQRLGFQS